MEPKETQQKTKAAAKTPLVVAAEDHRSFLASIVESSDDAIVGKTPEGIITSWNPAAERMYSYTAKEVVGKHISMLLPSDRPKEMEDILAKIRKGDRVEHYETLRMRKDGSAIHVSLTVSPIHDAAGRLI